MAGFGHEPDAPVASTARAAIVALTLVFVGCGLTIRALLAFVIRCADYVHRDSRLKAGLALAGTLLLLAGWTAFVRQGQA